MLNGTITGALEATITGGIAFSIDYNGTGLALGSHVWGVTDDGQEFFATDTGTGVGERTFNQVVSVAKQILSLISRDATVLSNGTGDLSWREICEPDPGIYHRFRESTGRENSLLSSFRVALMANLVPGEERRSPKLRQDRGILLIYTEIASW